MKLTKKQQEMVNTYQKSDMHSLRDLYTNYSDAKARAEMLIINEMIDNNGYSFRICGGNSCFFSCAYCYDIAENGKISKHLVYHTPQNKHDFIFEIEEK